MVVFSGTVQSDFLKNIPSVLDDKEKLIDFAAADFDTHRANLLSYVRANFPNDYNNFTESDFGVLLLEMMAAVGHIQSHKADYLANENFLKTARERSSVKKLLELIGVRMKGPISAVANAQLTFTAPIVTGTSSLVVPAANRVTTVTSPEDGGQLTFTLYKVNSDGTVDLENNSNNLNFTFDSVDSGETVTITDAVLMEGALVVESGEFTSPDAVKTINLTQSPYVEKSAQIFVDGAATTNGVYTEEDNIYFASGASDKIFQVTTDEAFRASILFGDNTVGLSPAVGDTYTVSYRVGGGTRGNIANSFINAPITGDANGTTETTVTLENISQATGGADAESVSKAKRYAPLKFRTQDRLVTLPDYKAFANSFISNYGSTGKATAVTRRAYSSANIVDLYVLERASNTQLRKATPEYKKQLLEAIEPKKMLTTQVVAVDGLIRTVDVVVTVTLDKKFKFDEPRLLSRARELVLNYFNIDNTDFGEAFIPQDLIKTILGEPQIRYATVDNIDDRITVGFNEVIQLNNLTIKAEYI